MKNILLLILVLPVVGFSQINRYSRTTTSNYEPMSYEDLMTVYRASRGSSTKISCNEAISFIESKVTYKDQVKNYTLDSSWLKSVTKYTYDGENFVIIEVKENEYSYKTKKYIFCGVPSSNWIKFKTGISGTFGERFHAYIFEHKCKCE